MKLTIAVLSFFIFFTFNSSDVFSHALFPDEVVTFIEKNPNITDDELNEFFKDKYGYGLDEYFAQEDVKDSLYDENFDVFSESEEYLSLEEKENLSENSLNALNNFTEKATKNIFLENALELKFDTEKKSIWELCKIYINIGVVHILDGLDHILFVLSLLLLPFVFRKILILISVFTIAHTITIILSGLNIITFSSKIVEPIIAFSIIVTTLTAIYLNIKNSKQDNISAHVFIIFIFGLFHGLGFAGAFSALKIESSNYLFPLILMNIGVELGQLFIIMIAFPIIWVVRNQKYGKIMLYLFSVITLFFAFYWLIERLS
ncbi:TPA: HupE/UreJ family protein [Candidatus Peregrinibacteria bacterium]|nr:HupE/UreJ family protein [Candidatus Peregrinibacteria bacterium]HIQ57671.1 HupE/UreJ family protein [Candidatus Gracilibacteria bacterium]